MINEKANKINSMVTTITMDHQFHGTQQISTAIAQLSVAAQQTVESLRDTNRALEQWEDASLELRAVISDFKV